MISTLSYPVLWARTTQQRKSRTVARTPAVDSSRAAKGKIGLKVALTEIVSGL